MQNDAIRLIHGLCEERQEALPLLGRHEHAAARFANHSKKSLRI